MRLYVPNHLCRVRKIIHSAKVKHSAKIEFPAVSPLANNQGIYAKKKMYHHLKVEPSLWALHYGSRTVYRVPDAHGKCRYAHGKAHTATRHQQSRPLPCARYRAHDKALPCANPDPRQKKKQAIGKVTWRRLCCVHCRRGTQQSLNPCRVPW